MEVLSLSPFRTGSIVWKPRPGEHALTIVCKATFYLTPGESRLADHQEHVVAADQYWNDDTSRSLVVASDLSPIKARCDVVLVGHAFAPQGEPVRALTARLSVGSIDKEIEIVGERPLGTKEPNRFTRMPLRWERAAGGVGTSNPVGAPSGPRSTNGGATAPNLVQPGAAATELTRELEPVGFGPVAPSWPTRSARLGLHARGFEYERWNEQTLPEDFDFGYFNAAPLDQQVLALRDSERISLTHLHREHPRLVTTLPGVHPRTLIQRMSAPPKEIVMKCDTLWIDTDRGLCTLTWRAQVALESPIERGRVVVALEKSGDRLDFADIVRIAGPVAGTHPSSPPSSSPFGVEKPLPILPIRLGTAPPLGIARLVIDDPKTRASAGAEEDPLDFAATSEGDSTKDIGLQIAVEPDPRSMTAPAQEFPHLPTGGDPKPPPSSRRVEENGRPKNVPVDEGAQSSRASSRDGGPPSRVPGAEAWVLAPIEPMITSGPASAPPMNGPTSMVASAVPSSSEPLTSRRVDPDPPERRAIDLLYCDDERAPTLRASFADVAFAQGARPREDFAKLLGVGAPLDARALEARFGAGAGADLRFEAPVVLLAGELTMTFDPFEQLRATLSAALTMHSEQGELERQVEATADALSKPWITPTVAGDLARRLRMTALQHDADGYLKPMIDRVLVEGRSYAKRTVLGGQRLAARLRVAGSEAPITAYLPIALAAFLPMVRAMRVRVVADVHPHQDEHDPHAFCLAIVAVGRVISLGPREESA